MSEERSGSATATVIGPRTLITQMGHIYLLMP
jgi:V8-like Glu-specific endopeptidase